MGLSRIPHIPLDELGAGPIALDTAIFIYLIERHPEWHPRVAPLFAAIDEGRFKAVTSALTLLELLVVPIRAGNVALAERYEALLTRGRGLTMIELDRDLLKAAAQLRARFNVRTPDALQLAAGLRAGATTFVTNDRALPDLPGMRVLQLAGRRGA